MARGDFPTSVRLSRDVKAQLVIEADRESRSLSWMINNILRQWLAWKKDNKRK